MDSLGKKNRFGSRMSMWLKRKNGFYSVQKNSPERDETFEEISTGTGSGSNELKIEGEEEVLVATDFNITEDNLLVVESESTRLLQKVVEDGDSWTTLVTDNCKGKNESAPSSPAKEARSKVPHLYPIYPFRRSQTLESCQQSLVSMDSLEESDLELDEESCGSYHTPSDEDSNYHMASFAEHVDFLRAKTHHVEICWATPRQSETGSSPFGVKNLGAYLDYSRRNF